MTSNPKPSATQVAKATVAPNRSGEKARSLVRGLAVLQRISDQPGQLRASDVIREFKMPRASAYQLLGVLLEKGFIAIDPSKGAYTLGIQCYRLGISYQANAVLLREGRAVLRALRDDTAETTQLSILDNCMNVVVLREEGPGRLTFLHSVGSHLPVNWSASGSLLVSDWSDSELRSRIAPLLKPAPTGNAPVDIEILIKEIRKFRKQGFATRFSTTHTKVAMIAAPVLGVSGDCVAAITLVIYEPSLTAQRRRLLIPKVCAAANELSELIKNG